MCGYNILPVMNNNHFQLESDHYCFTLYKVSTHQCRYDIIKSIISECNIVIWINPW